MRQQPPLPAPVLRAREIHRQVRIPRVAEAIDLVVVLRSAKANVVFEKIRDGLARRLK